MPQNLIGRTSTAAELWVRALSGAYNQRTRIYDPSNALARDIDVYEKLMRDAVIAHAVQQRKHMVAGSRWQCDPWNARPENKLAAQVMEECLAYCDNFDTARFNLSEAIFRGSAYAYIEGERRIATIFDGKPRMWWLPTRIRDLTKFRMRQVPRHDPDTQEITIDMELWSISRERWEPIRPENKRAIIQHLYGDTEETLGHGAGLVDAMYHYWRAKELVLTENLSAIERFAQGLLVAKIDSKRMASTGNDNTAIVSAFITELEKHKARHILAIDKDDELEVISPSGEGHQLFEDMRNYLDNALRVLILGSNLPSSADKGGSYALAEVQENSTQSLIGYDRRILGQTLTRSLVNLIWTLNSDSIGQLGMLGAMPPKLMIIDEQNPDHKTEAEINQILLTAGMPLKKDEAYQLVGRTMPGPGDEIIEPVAPPSPFGGGEFGGGDGGGGEFGGEKKPEKKPEEKPSEGDGKEESFQRGMQAAAAMMAATAKAAPIHVSCSKEVPPYALEANLVAALKSKRERMEKSDE